MYCLCVNVYCHRVRTQLQLINILYYWFCKLKEAALNRSAWRVRSARGYGPFVRRTAERMNAAYGIAAVSTAGAGIQCDKAAVVGQTINKLPCNTRTWNWHNLCSRQIGIATIARLYAATRNSRVEWCLGPLKNGPCICCSSEFILNVISVTAQRFGLLLVFGLYPLRVSAWRPSMVGILFFMSVVVPVGDVWRSRPTSVLDCVISSWWWW
jgi:hypothetical protein